MLGLEVVKVLIQAAVESGSEESLHELVDWAMSNPNPEESVLVLELFDVLRSQGALLQLQMLAYSQSAPALVSGARQKLEEISQNRGLRVWELEDLIVPTCGLETQEEYPFEIQGRAYQLRLGTELEPLFVDSEGKFISPADQVLSPEVQRVIDDLADVLPTQILRLEMALGMEQRWRAKHWAEHVLGHPVLVHLVQRLIWGVFSESGRLLETFRVSEEGELSDVNDKPLEVAEDHFIGALHPVNVSSEVLQGWNATLADYEIPTLCPQLDRPVFTYEPELAKAHSLTIGSDVFGNGTPRSWVVSGLLSRGWQLRDSYYGATYTKIFRHSDVMAQAQLSNSGEMVDSTSLTFQRFLGHPRHNFQFRDLNPLVYSEAILDLRQVTDGYRRSR